MVDEAFALSPISARAAQPSEADYDAIREAFMETSRGRWFLGEYAKRNRNADTLQVLDAVARIEETLAAQKKPARDPMLDEALVAIRHALGEAKGATEAALGHLSLEQNLPPIRKGARVIREIAWRLREIGADGRICDLIDSQVNAIDGAAAKMAPAELANALGGVFDLIEARIAAFDADDMANSDPLPEAARSEAAETASAVAGTMQQQAPAAPSFGKASAHALDGAAETPVAEAEPADAFTSDDEAMLDMVAMEMAAPDSDEAYIPSIDEMSGHEMEQGPSAPPSAAVDSPAASATVTASTAMEQAEGVSADDIEMTFPGDEPSLIAAPAAPIEIAPPKTTPVIAPPAAAPIQSAAPAASIEVTPPAEPAPSLGSSLLANGIVLRPKIPKVDPFAPIRRMTQSEKIAFFS